ncbi:putative permease [Methanomethylovorans hollandica DSM 15978]|uniref:Putative permease n=1 Tax=Methanomethylovorans hollandica (strain DSM 15978 / NBRC 107637 / DMS1) TaxID=867904 RepID=L0KVR3_METHD|nr:AI-2E family transporter [Methanomethylovorans hollandica]AGB49532.1 putative permease [Methanomethylovorans hollandica DSM 15978]
MERPFKMAMALLMLAVLAAVLIHALLPYINAFLGAFIIFVILRPLYHFMVRRGHLSRSISALMTIFLSFVLILVPLYFLISTIATEIQNVLQYINSIPIYAEVVRSFLENLHLEQLPINLDIKTKVIEVASAIANYSSVMLLSAVQSIGQRLIEFTIMSFLLYYLFTEEDSDFVKSVYSAIPFNRENSDKLLEEFRVIVKTTLVSSLIIAIIQGGLLTVAFLLLGIQGAILWGALAALLSFIPLVGATVVWIPAVIIQLLQQDYFAAVGILIAGILVSTMDNFVRPFIQKKLGSLHPMISLLGIIIGINLFGLIGLVVGPLLLSYFLLVVRMFHEEYVANHN